VRRTINHPQYNVQRSFAPEMSYDIALIELAVPVQYTDKIRPICLPTTIMNYNQQMIPKTMLSAGWGSGKHVAIYAQHLSAVTPTGDNGSNMLRQATLYTVNNDICANTLVNGGNITGPLKVASYP
jgi:hypothetical protein